MAVLHQRQQALQRSVRQDAAMLTDKEHEIAQTKLAILRTLGHREKFVPNLMGMRFTPELACGLQRKNPDSAPQAGVLMGALLCQEHALADSPPAQRLREAIQARQQAPNAETSHADQRFWAQRTSALQPQEASIGLLASDLAAVGLAEQSSEDIGATLSALARTGLSGIDEVQGALRKANQALASMKALKLANKLKLLPAMKNIFHCVETLQVGESRRWALRSLKALTSLPIPFAPVPSLGVIVALEHRSLNCLQVSRTDQGYQLTVCHGKSGAGFTGVAWGGLIPKLFTAQAMAGVKVQGHRLAGVALAFPHSTAGRKQVQKLVARLLMRGNIESNDLAGASQVMPVVERKIGGAVMAGVRADVRIPTVSALAGGSKDTLTATVGALGDVELGVHHVVRTQENSQHHIEEHTQSFHAKVDAFVWAGVGLMDHPEGACGELNFHKPKALELPVLCKTGNLGHIHCKVTMRDVRENDLVVQATERVVHIQCPPALAKAAVARVGGAPWQSLIDHLSTSDNVEDTVLLARLNTLILEMKSGDEIGVVWRLDPLVQEAANRLLQKARTAAHRQGPTSDMTGCAVQWKTQATTLLRDPEHYQLHGLERIAYETSTLHLGRLRDLSKVDLGVVRWGQQIEDERKLRTPVSVVAAARTASGGKPAIQRDG